MTESGIPSTQLLKGKTSLVTGSTSGIGLGIARALAGAGSAVILNGFGDPKEIEAVQQKIASEYSVPVAYDPCDVSMPESIEKMVKRVIEEFGNVDVLVNNAGIQYVAPLQEFPTAKWDAIIAIDLSAAFHTTRLVLPGMATKGWGRIVNVASAHALVGSPFKSAYVAAKHGLLGLTKVTALETAEQGITCNAICPGYVNTPLVEMQIENQAKAHGIPRRQVIRDILLAQQPNKQFATIDQLSSLVLFLCSDVGTSITGAAIPIDGGWTAH